jgi:hypothetical protein
MNDKSTPVDGTFIGYEYRDITVSRELESLYADGYQSFGWKAESAATPFVGFGSVTMKFKRDRKIRNKAELTRLQRQFDACINEILSMEKSKESSAFVKAMTVGLIGTAFIAGATFSFLGGIIPLCIVLAVPGFVGWILPYFLFNSTLAKRAAKIAPLIEGKYDEIYEICERGSKLL